MSNKEQINESQLIKYVNQVLRPRKTRSVFDITDEIGDISEQKRESDTVKTAKDIVDFVSSKSGQVVSKIKNSDARQAVVDKVADTAHNVLGDAPVWAQDATTSVEQGSEKLYSGTKRVINAQVRALDKKFNFDGSKIKQAIIRISGNDYFLGTIKSYFKMYGDICYRSLLNSEDLGFEAPVFTDPGIYCLNPGLKLKIDSWYNKRRKEFINYYRKTNKRSRLAVLKVFANNFISTFDSRIC